MFAKTSSHSSSTTVSSGPAAGSEIALALLAVTLPTAVAFNVPPSPTFFNQAAAIALWGAVVAAAARNSTRLPVGGALPLIVALAGCAAAVSLPWASSALPTGLALSGIAMALCALIVAVLGTLAGNPCTAHPMFVAFVVAGIFSGAVGALQVFAPDLPDGQLIARSGLTGRAVGNVRQPNHLSSLLLWSAVAVVPLIEMRRVKRAAGVAALAFMVLGLVLSGSRTGVVGVLALAVWGFVDRKLSRTSRGLLVSAPLWFSLFWMLMAWWAHETDSTFGAAAHVASADPSSSRFGIWSNTLQLIARHPGTGVGFGEFNFAWTLTPFPDRPVAFFDHTHNLPLQLAVELGLPLAALVLTLLGWALWLAWRNSVAAQGTEGVALRAAFMMVLLMALHSMLEYPLWYAYFLLPTAWMWGYCLGASPRQEPSEPPPRRSRWLLAAGVAMVIGSAFAVHDYLRVAQIFAPSDNAPPLAERIADGQRSVFFAHHADYAAVTTTDDPATVPDGFKRAPHYLLDTRLMMAWAKSLAAQGELDKARHIAQRLREFRRPEAEAFFVPCEDGTSPPPFQCEPPSRVVDWREFR